MIRRCADRPKPRNRVHADQRRQTNCSIFWNHFIILVHLLLIFGQLYDRFNNGGAGPDTEALILKVNQVDTELVDLTIATHTTQNIGAIHGEEAIEFGRALCALAITNIDQYRGEIFVAGVSNEEFDPLYAGSNIHPKEMLTPPRSRFGMRSMQNGNGEGAGLTSDLLKSGVGSESGS